MRLPADALIPTKVPSGKVRRLAACRASLTGMASPDEKEWGSAAEKSIDKSTNNVPQRRLEGYAEPRLSFGQANPPKNAEMKRET